MNPQTFFDHFERLTDAPNAVARLRELVLQLAVQGKLVEQDERDELASRLLERIAAERKRLVREKKIKEAKPLPPVSDDEMPFVLPSSWAWARLGSASMMIQIGPFGSQLHKSDYVQNGTPLVNPSHIKEEGIVPSNKLTVDVKTKQRLSNYVMKSGDVVMGRRGEMGKCALVAEKEDGWLCGTGSLFIRLTEHLFPRYLLKVLVSEHTKSYLLSSSVGATMNNLNQKILDNLLVPIPPLEEQKRIVAKVDALMRLCDELERAQVERREARQRFSRAALDQLPVARNAAEFQARWQIISDHFPTLTATPDQFSKLRQTILQLAVQGKLTRQVPQDEPAPALLRRISAERERLVKEKRLKRADPLPRLNPDEIPLALPSGWVWARLQDVFLTVTDGDHIPPPKIESGVPFLVISNVRTGTLDFSSTRHVPLDYYEALDETRRPTAGDILYTVVGSYGIPVTVKTDIPFCVQRHIAILKSSRQTNADYLNYALQSNFSFEQARKYATGIAQKTVPLSGLRKLFIPLPPLEEQKRIVVVINCLMALCDELEADLRRAEDDGERLLRAAVRSLLAPALDNSVKVPALA